jgi:hypothetical protein
MKDLDIKKMLLEGLIKQMDESDGKRYKKPVAVVIEKHTTDIPTDDSEDDGLPDLGDATEEDDADAAAHIKKLGARIAGGK